jgi:hypothetical protein
MRNPIASFVLADLIAMGVCFLGFLGALWMARYWRLKSEGYDDLELLPEIVLRYARWNAKLSGTSSRRGDFSPAVLRFGAKFLKIMAYCWFLGIIIFEIDMVIRLYLHFVYTR